MTDLEQLARLEALARAERNKTFGHVIRGREVSVMGISAMINRGMATGDTTRLLYKLDGKRASAAAVEDHVCGESR